MALDLRQHLNDAQYKAVTTIDRPVLVIAGAGSGKTRVIEYRTLHLIQSGFLPETILMLTFTRKAAHEMLTRASRHDVRCEQIDGGTFHSFAYKLLKHYAKAIGFTNQFAILDESDGNELIGQCMTKLGFLDLKKRFPKKETLKSIISKSVNKQTSIKHILEREFPQFEEFTVEIEQLRQAYTRIKIETNYVDYDDLLVYLKLLLEKFEIRDRLAQQYKHIMVDEYQDTNKLQGDIAYLLAESHGNIMAVGDDAQSIYGFRGANHQNIMDFPVRFPNCEIIKLEKNYRSTQTILDVGNAVLNNMRHKYEKRLTAALDELGNVPQLLCFKNPYEEASWIASSIKRLRDEGVPIAKQAVLFRSAYISIPLQAELNKLNIPYVLYGGYKFYETAHVKDVMSYLKILFNPKDELAWSRILKLLEGIGPKTAETIVETIRSSGSFVMVVETVKTRFGVGYSYSDKIKTLAEMLRKVDAVKLTVADQLRVIVEYYEPILKRLYDDWHQRQDDLETVIELAANYKSLETFLADFALEPPERGVSEVIGETEDEKPVTLSTIHSAKGLEWDVVYVLGMIDGVLPSRFSLNHDDDIEEEHRLFYVAVTRAKKQLFLCMHHEGSMGGMYQFNRVSRFLENRNILERLEQKMMDRPHYGSYAGDAHEEGEPKRLLISDDGVDEIYDKKALFKKINDFWRK